MQQALAYTTIHMEDGEGLEYAYASVGRMTKRNPIIYVVDIIVESEQQHDDAHTFATLIKARILALNKQLTEDDIFMGIVDVEDADTIRPGVMMAMQALDERGIDLDLTNSEMVDINPERKI